MKVHRDWTMGLVLRINHNSQMPTLEIQAPLPDIAYQKNFIHWALRDEIRENQDNRLLVPSRRKEALLQVAGLPGAGRLTYAERFSLFSYRNNTVHCHVHARVNILCTYADSNRGMPNYCNSSTMG